MEERTVGRTTMEWRQGMNLKKWLLYISQWKDSYPSTTGDQKTGLYSQHPTCLQIPNDKGPPCDGRWSTTTTPQLNPKSLKKLKTDRDIFTPRNRSRSRNRHKTQEKNIPHPPHSTTLLLLHTQMDYKYKIATININGMSAPARIQMLE